MLAQQHGLHQQHQVLRQGAGLRRVAQRLGFSLDQVTDLLRLQDGTHCDDARRLAEAKLADVRDKLADLQRIESALGTLVARCADHGGSIACPLIESLQSG